MLRRLSAAISGGLTAFLLASPAGAAARPMEVSVNGAAFTHHPTAPAFGVRGLVPGGSQTVELGVRSFSAAAPLSVRLTTEQDTAGLGAKLRFDIAVAPTPSGTSFRTVWSGQGAEFSAGVETGTDVASGHDQWLRLTATLPASAGNEAAGQAYTFGLRIQLEGSGVDGVSVGGGGGSASSPAHGGLGLGAVSVTGVPLPFLLGLAAILGGAGGLLVAASRRRTVRRIGSRTARR